MRHAPGDWRICCLWIVQSNKHAPHTGDLLWVLEEIVQDYRQPLLPQLHADDSNNLGLGVSDAEQ